MSEDNDPHFDMPDQPQPGENSEMESLYDDLRINRSALAGLVGVMDFIFDSGQLTAMAHGVLLRNSHVVRAYNVLGLDLPKERANQGIPQ